MPTVPFATNICQVGKFRMNPPPQGFPRNYAAMFPIVDRPDANPETFGVGFLGQAGILAVLNEKPCD
jgi:hypothetical protein